MSKDKEFVEAVKTAEQLEAALNKTTYQNRVAVLDIYSSEWGPCRSIIETFRLQLANNNGFDIKFYSVECNAILQGLHTAEKPKKKADAHNEQRETAPEYWQPILESRRGKSKPYFLFYKEGKKVAFVDGVNTPQIKNVMADMCTAKQPAEDFIVNNQTLLSFWCDKYDPADSNVAYAKFLSTMYEACKYTVDFDAKERETLGQAIGVVKDVVTAAGLYNWFGTDENRTFQNAITTTLPGYEERATRVQLEAKEEKARKQRDEEAARKKAEEEERERAEAQAKKDAEKTADAENSESQEGQEGQEGPKKMASRPTTSDQTGENGERPKSKTPTDEQGADQPKTDEPKTEQPKSSTPSGEKPSTPSDEKKVDSTRASGETTADQAKPSTPSGEKADVKPSSTEPPKSTTPSEEKKADSTTDAPKSTTPSGDQKPTTPSGDQKPTTPSGDQSSKPTTPSGGDKTSSTEPPKSTTPSGETKADEAKSTTTTDAPKSTTPSGDQKPTTPSGDQKPTTPSGDQSSKPTTPSVGDKPQTTTTAAQETKPTTPSNDKPGSTEPPKSTTPTQEAN